MATPISSIGGRGSESRPVDDWVSVGRLGGTVVDGPTVVVSVVISECPTIVVAVVTVVVVEPVVVAVVVIEPVVVTLGCGHGQNGHQDQQ